MAEIHETKRPVTEQIDHDQPTHVVDVGDGLTAQKEGAKIAKVHNVSCPHAMRPKTNNNTVGRDVCGYPRVQDQTLEQGVYPSLL